MRDIKRLRLIRDKILENKLDPKVPIQWMPDSRIRKLSRILEELHELRKLNYADGLSLSLINDLKRNKLKQSVESINHKIEEIAYHIDLKIDELHHKSNKTKTWKKVLLGGMIASKIFLPGHEHIESQEIKNPQKQEQKQEHRGIPSTEKPKVMLAQKEHLSKKQKYEIKEMTDIVYAEVCEYGSPKKYNPHIIVAVASTILNRVEQRPKEFGKTIHDVIHKKNAYYGLKNRMYKEAKKLKFSSEENKQSYINIYQLVKKVYLGKTKRYPGFFFFTPKEVKKLKNSKHFNFALLEYNFSIGPYYVYSYKT